MAEISNVLGSGGYSGGFLGNLTSGLEALQRTDIASKLEAIRQQKAWDRDDKMRNEAFALEMALPKIIEDRRIGLAQETAQKADLFTKKLTDVTRKAQAEGRGLSLAEKIALKTERGVLLNESERAKAFIDALEEGQKFHLQTLQKLDPTEKDLYNQQWADLYSRMKNPATSKNLSASDVMNAIQPPPPPAYKTYEEFDKTIKNAAVNVETPQELKHIIAAQSKPRANALIGIGSASGDFGDEQQLVDYFYERNKGLIDRTRVAGSGGGLGYGLGKTALDFEPEQVTIANRDYNLVNTPTTVPQSARSYALKGAVNLTTGEQTKKLDKAQVVGVDVDQNKILFKSGGGLAKVGDELALFREGDRPSYSQGKWTNGVAESDLEKPSVQQAKLMGAYERQNPEGNTPKEIKNTSIEKTEDGYVLRGEAVVKGGITDLWKTKTIPVSVAYKTANDPRPESFYEAPLSENKSAVANWMSKVAINGKPMGQYFEEYKTQKPQVKAEQPKAKTSVTEVQRKTKDGRIAIFDANTKQFIRYAE